MHKLLDLCIYVYSFKINYGPQMFVHVLFQKSYAKKILKFLKIKTIFRIFFRNFFFFKSENHKNLQISVMLNTISKLILVNKAKSNNTVKVRQ